MNRKVLLGLITVPFILSSCSFSNGSKPLMGGDIGHGDKSLSENRRYTGNSSDATSELSVTNCATTDDICLPALNLSAGEQILRRTAYTALYDKNTRLPRWVAWQLTAEHADGKFTRKGIKFREDTDVPEPRATDRDYVNSGFDRGHMCPSADCKWSEEVQLESFLFTNACPQHHGLNAGDWNEIEQQCRRWAKEYGSIYIVSGPILYKGRHKTIGKNKIVVPEAFFKVVLCTEGTPKAIGFIYKNEAGNRPKSSYVNTVDEVERITGFDFFAALPDDIETRVEAKADLAEWGIR